MVASGQLVIAMKIFEALVEDRVFLGCEMIILQLKCPTNELLSFRRGEFRDFVETHPDLFHPIKRFLQEFQITRLTELLASIINPLLFQSVFGRAVVLVEDAEDAGER